MDARWFFVHVCRVLLWIFFREIEVTGRERVPRNAAVLYVVNHPNALIDPLFLLCLADRRVSFLAKEPLFRMFFVRWFVRAFESLPVYRSQDGGDPEKNRRTLQDARRLLERGNAIALFPEGTSHSEPSLKPLRTGAARLALSTRAICGKPVFVVPTSIYYEEKQTFRSRAALNFGAPLRVPVVPLNEDHEPDSAAARGFTEEIHSALISILPTAETLEGLALGETAERIITVAAIDAAPHCPTAVRLLGTNPSDGDGVTLATRIERRTRLLDTYQALIHTKSLEVHELIERISLLRAEFETSGLPVDSISVETGQRMNSLRLLLALTALSPLAALGLAAFSPAYYAVRWIAIQYSREETDIKATVKVLAGALLFPLSWLLIVGVVFYRHGALGAILAGCLLVVSAVATLKGRDLWGALAYRRGKNVRGARLPIDWQEVRVRRARVAEDIARLITAIDEK